MDNEGRPEEREDGPLAIEIDAPIPAHPRPDRRTIVATTAEYGRWRLSRVGLDLDDAVEEETDDYRRGLGGKTGAEADAYAAGEPDVALWEGERCLALIRPLPGGEPEVLRFDEPAEGEDHKPRPTSKVERHAWRLVKYLGAEAARDALVERMMPSGPGRASLTPAEESVLFFVRTIGEGEALDRLYLAGPYGVIRDAIRRLGSDAVAELRKTIIDRRDGA